MQPPWVHWGAVGQCQVAVCQGWVGLLLVWQFDGVGAFGGAGEDGDLEVAAVFGGAVGVSVGGAAGGDGDGDFVDGGVFFGRRRRWGWCWGFGLVRR